MYGNYENVSNDELRAAIDKWIKGPNARRNREILKSRLIDGLTFEQLAEEYELSVRHTKTIVYKLEYILYKHI